jgi:hypothetical protein
MRAKDHPTSTYVATIEASIDAAYDAFTTLDPMSSLTSRLCALGVDAHAVRAESPGPSGDGEREVRFRLLWPFGASGESAQVDWHVRLTDDGAGGTVLSIVIHARASAEQAGGRIVAGWPIIESIALEHAKSLRRAVDEYEADPSEAEQPVTVALLNAAA